MEKIATAIDFLSVIISIGIFALVLMLFATRR